MHRMCVCAFCPCAACALQGFLENQADSQGLSKAQILLVVLYMVVPVMLAIAMTFILFAIGAWQNEGSFNAVVQSALILGVGKASASLRSKSKAENADNLDELVGNIMNEQKEAVNGE
jgi:membrane protein implicated in regulation of membrane protease activity